MGQQQKLTPAGAVLMGLAFVACGVFPILVGLGLVTPSSADTAPPWVVVSAGLLFVFAGFALVIDYAVAGGVGPDGDLPADDEKAKEQVSAADGERRALGLMFLACGTVGVKRFIRACRDGSQPSR